MYITYPKSLKNSSLVAEQCVSSSLLISRYKDRIEKCKKFIKENTCEKKRGKSHKAPETFKFMSLTTSKGVKDGWMKGSATSLGSP